MSSSSKPDVASRALTTAFQPATTVWIPTELGTKLLGLAITSDGADTT